MTRKALLTPALFVALGAAANTYEGDWYKYPVFSDAVDDILETSSKVYYLSGVDLFSYRPSDSESYYYNMLNRLSDNYIDKVFHNYDKDYLLLAYDNGNIDLVYDDGRVVNLPEIKDSSVSSKKINDVAFSGDRIAVATDFGIVIYNDERGEVVESGIYNQPVHCIEIVGDHLLIYGDVCTGFQLMASPLNVRHNNLDKFTAMGGCSIRELQAIDSEHVLVRERDSRQLSIRRLDFGGHRNTVVVPYSDAIVVNAPVRRYADGLYTTTDRALVLVQGTEIKTVPLGEALAGDRIALRDDPARVWSGDSDGIARYDISGAQPSALTDRTVYPGATTDRRVGYMRWSPDRRRLYISNMECSGSHIYAKGEGSHQYQTTNYIEDGNVTDVSLKQASATHSISTQRQQQYGNTRMYGDPTFMLQDVDNPDIYYAGNYFEGLYVIGRGSDGEYREIGKFDGSNSTITDNWGPRVLNVDIDREGNLWVGHQFGGNFSVLPAAKRRMDPSSITAQDWRTYTKLPADYQQKDLMMVLTRQSDMLFYSMAKYEKGFVAVDTKGTLANPDDDTVYFWNKIVDQDGNELSYSYINYFVEDKRGCVWVGTSAGVFEITNPRNATNPAMTVRHIKVPRNDGTNYADYLLESEFINWIAVDPSDRKWIATENSGLYLVSPTGDRILRHYDTSNSPLPSNSVWCVECDPDDNTVYVGTANGLYTFRSDSSQPQSDYSEIYAFPNPVRPEYSGLVTITGLMDNSVVKVADAAGNVIYETRSEGGMATWDACDATGSRVKSGVYYVYASENNSGTASGAVTKILVIN